MESGYLVEKAGSRWNGKVSPPLVAEPRQARFTTSPDCLLGGGAAIPGCIPMFSSLLAPKQAGSRGGCVEKRFNCSVQQEQTRFRSGARSHAAGGDAVLHLAACLQSGSQSREERFAWSASPASGEVRTVCVSGGRRRD